MESTETKDFPELESFFNTVRAFVTKTEFKRVLTLEERVRHQRETIAAKDKEIAQLKASGKIHQAELSVLLSAIKDGDVLKNGYGRTTTVVSFGPTGFVDENGKENSWGYGGATSWKKVEREVVK